MAFLSRCLCFDLRTGTLIIAVVSMIVSCGDIVLSVLLFTCEQDCKFAIPVLVKIFLQFLCHLITSSLLIHGVRKNRPGLMTPYLAWEIGFSITLVGFAVDLQTLQGASFEDVVFFYLAAAVLLCFVAVVKSYQKQVYLVNSGWQQHLGGKNAPTYMRLI